MVDLDLARVRPHPEVPVRRQIAAWLASGIRDGEVAAGARLPSVRRLAELVGVHRNTAWEAYGELARQGLVRRVEGSGVYASGVYASVPAARTSRRERAGARRAGVQGAGVHGAGVRGRAPAGGWHHPCPNCGFLDIRPLPAPRRTLTVVEEGPGLRSLLAAELRRALAGRGVEVRAMPGRPVGVGAVPGSGSPARPVPGFRSPGAPDRYARDAFGKGGFGLCVGLPSACRRVSARVPLEVPPEPLALRGGRSELRLVAELRAPAVVAVLTVSRRVRAFALELLAGWAGIGVAAPRPDDPAAVARAVRIADLIFADASFEDVPGGGGAPVRLLRCIRRDSLLRVAARLGLLPAGRGASGPTTSRSSAR